MDVQITCRNGELEPEIRERILNKVTDLNRFNDSAITAHAIVNTVPKSRQSMELKLKLKTNNYLTSSATADLLGKAVDECVDKMSRQISKVNKKQKSHRVRKISMQEELSA